MLLLRDLVLFVFDVGLEVSPLVLQLAGEVENLSLQRADLLRLRQDLLLHLSVALVGPESIVFQLCLISCLHLRLLDKHLLLDLVHLLLLFDFHLIDYPSILFSQLLNIMHQLLVRFLSLVVRLLKVRGLLVEVPGGLDCIFELLSKILLNGLIVAFAETEAQMVRCFELICLNYLEDGFAGHTNIKHANERVLRHHGRIRLLLLHRALLAEVKELNELVRELLEVNHDLLLVLEDVIVLLRAVHGVDEIWVLLVGDFDREHLRLRILAVWRVNYHLDGQWTRVVFAVLRPDLDIDARLVDSSIELKFV